MYLVNFVLLILKLCSVPQCYVSLHQTNLNTWVFRLILALPTLLTVITWIETAGCHLSISFCPTVRLLLLISKCGSCVQCCTMGHFWWLANRNKQTRDQTWIGLYKATEPPKTCADQSWFWSFGLARDISVSCWKKTSYADLAFVSLLFTEEL